MLEEAVVKFHNRDLGRCPVGAAGPRGDDSVDDNAPNKRAGFGGSRRSLEMACYKAIIFIIKWPCHYFTFDWYPPIPPPAGQRWVPLSNKTNLLPKKWPPPPPIPLGHSGAAGYRVEW
jgi:hypothetical protein